MLLLAHFHRLSGSGKQHDHGPFTALISMHSKLSTAQHCC
jgi:hypothetical protein